MKAMKNWMSKVKDKYCSKIVDLRIPSPSWVQKEPCLSNRHIRIFGPGTDLEHFLRGLNVFGEKFKGSEKKLEIFEGSVSLFDALI